MKFISHIFASVSGSMGGTTFARNSFGQYTRVRATPVNPNSTAQQFVRQAFANLVNRWNDVLTDAQRGSWKAYASQVSLVDSLGQTQFLSGQQHYIRANTPRHDQRVQATIVDQGPSTFNTGQVADFGIDLSAANDEVDISWTGSPDWESEVGAYLLLYASRPVSPTRDFFKGPYRLAGVIPGAATPPTSPQTIALPFPIEVGQRVYVKGRVSYADGRLSSPFQVNDVAAA